MSLQSDYLHGQLLGHVNLFFDPAVTEALRALPLRFLPYGEAVHIRKPGIVIPTDIPAPVRPENPWTVPFNETQLTLWNPLPEPEHDDWQALPGYSAPLWYKHRSGTLIPAWNLFANLFDLLTFREERESQSRDKHGRFIAAYSPRLPAGLLEVPAFNEAAAAITAAAYGLQHENQPRFHLDGLVKPPAVVPSHDCDILMGNDKWTQSVRAYRILQPLLHGRWPRLQNLWWIFKNAIWPRLYYFDNATGMIDLERVFGYASIFYLLNGRRGRFGARSGIPPLRQLLNDIPDGWRTGIHYNYDTLLDENRFSSQTRELAALVGGPVTRGRAHYLRLDPEKSFGFWAEHGIRIDESAGYPDRIGYRCGIGGCFQLFDSVSRKLLDIWETPIVVMEATLMEQYGDASVSAFERLLRHLKQVGGALTLVVHPGMFFNPEFPEMLDLYHRILISCRNVGAVSSFAEELVVGMQKGVHPS